jgi:ABC-type phosphate transport system auxiliary subunit|uniref:Uncharacterized protein n=1 Tax=Desulfomonile tiedjei TaxID=2358 RepID=A0A7C4EUA2_9BACT
MTAKQKQWARLAILVLLLIVAVVWKGQVYFSSWQGTVTQIVLPESGENGYVVVRDDKNRYFRVTLPKTQLTELREGDKLGKDRFTLGVKILEKAPPPSGPTIH